MYFENFYFFHINNCNSVAKIFDRLQSYSFWMTMVVMMIHLICFPFFFWKGIQNGCFKYYSSMEGSQIKLLMLLLILKDFLWTNVARTYSPNYCSVGTLLTFHEFIRVYHNFKIVKAQSNQRFLFFRRILGSLGTDILPSKQNQKMTLETEQCTKLESKCSVRDSDDNGDESLKQFLLASLEERKGKPLSMNDLP